MKAKKVIVCIAPDVLETLDRRLNGRARNEFIREAITEKMLRDFDEAFPASSTRISRGTRTDLHEANEETREKMRTQAAKARESRWKK